MIASLAAFRIGQVELYGPSIRVQQRLRMTDYGRAKRLFRDKTGSRGEYRLLAGAVSKVQGQHRHEFALLHVLADLAVVKGDDTGASLVLDTKESGIRRSVQISERATPRQRQIVADVPCSG